MNPWLIGFPAATAFAGAAIAHAAVNPQSQIFGATIHHTGSPEYLAITFDDGPNPAITPQLLSLLDRFGVKATFFVIGRYVQECPEITREILNRGHLLANHTQTHPNLFWLGENLVRNELQQCQKALQEATGAAAKFFRPPFGMRNPWVVSTAHELGMQTVTWSLIPGDWRDKPLEWLVKRMQPIARNAEKKEKKGAGDVLCLHDGAHRQQNGDRARTIAALEYWLPRWRDSGLKFVTIAEAVNSPAIEHG
jgi:peptidoglycan/xylan/chitin deacetylase (PgdA/CDA1 family)